MAEKHILLLDFAYYFENFIILFNFYTAPSGYYGQIVFTILAIILQNVVQSIHHK